MTKHSKRYQEVATKIDKETAYSPDEAIKLVKESKTKFDAAVELHVRLGIDTKKGEEQVRGAVSLPHGTGKTKRIAAFVGPDKEKEAEGADIVGGEELIKKIKTSGKIDFDIAIATPDMMQKLAVIAKMLGPIGLMPSPKNETITKNIGKTIEELKKGRVNFKNDSTGIIHQVIGRVSFDEKQLSENYQMLMDAIIKSKPSSSKGIYIRSISLSSSMGPGIKVSISQ